MNSLIILPQELIGPNRAHLTGARAQYAFKIHRVRQGDIVKAAILGGMRGEAKIISASPQGVECELHLSHESLPTEQVIVIVGVSRPQTIKKVIQAATMLGVTALHFVRSELGESSYLQSHTLRPDYLQEEVIKALEQVWDSRAPEIKVHPNFSYFMRNRFVEIEREIFSNSGAVTPHRFVAHPGGTLIGVNDAQRLRSLPIVMAIGPERGWSAAEIEVFRSLNFEVVGLGERVVRVELAISLFLGMIAALRR